MKKDDRRTIIVVACVCLVCIVAAVLLSLKSNFQKLSPVDDYSVFFSVVNETDKYIDFLSKKNKGEILNILSEKYITDNDISYDNVFDLLGNYPIESILSVSKIEYVSVGKNNLYFVNGKIVETNYNDIDVVDDNFKILVLNDIYNNTFSVYPVNEDNYRRVINHIKKIKIDGNSSNKMIKSKEFTDVDICKLYFSDFIGKLFNGSNDAYLLLNDRMKRQFSDSDEFKSFINSNIDKISFSTKLCNFSEGEKYREYTVVDGNDNVFSFTESGVMDYVVYFNFKSSDD